MIDPIWVLVLAMAIGGLELLVRLFLTLRQAPHLRVWQGVLHPVAGLCLMGAVYEALTLARPVWLLGWITAAGLAHLIDVALRWRQG